MRYFFYRNLQGWRTGTSVAYDGMPVFGELLCHYDPMMGVPQYSGMISEISYGHGDMMDMQSYSYDYDGLGRFTYSDHYLNGSLAEENFETGFRYDRNGNILSFERYGNRMNYYTGTNLEDNPEFHYDGNRLVRAQRLPFIDEDGNFEENPDCLYSYDSNGSITHDGHQGLDISYNVLNFPKTITNDEGMTATYTYLSDGTKRSVSTHDGLGKLYRGSFVYDGGAAAISTATLESIATPEGRLAVTDDGILDLWYAKDYLGNVRSVIDLASGVIEEIDYLPFGTRIQDDNQPVMSDNRWRYANKEEQSSLVGGSCNLIDFGARNYDPWSARWTTIDPMAEKYYGITPYGYCSLSPVNRIDLTGEDDYYFDERGNFSCQSTEDLYDRIFMSNGNSMVVNDKSILSGMTTKKYKHVTSESDEFIRTLTYTTTESDSQELVAVFGFLQENSSVEWGLYHGESGRSLLGTTKDSDVVRTDVLFYYDSKADYENKVNPYDSKIHGHPGEDASRIAPSMEVDINNVIKDGKIQSYVYFPVERQIYKATAKGPQKVSSYRNWSPK